MLPPDKLWELIVKIREITGIAFDLQTKEGLGLDHFLDESRYSQFHSDQNLLTDPDSLYQIMGMNEGWAVFGKEINEARSWVYETQAPETVHHHGGMAWIVIPIVIDGAVLGTIENRNLISIDGPDLEWHRKAISEWDINGRRYSNALKNIPIYSTRRINEIVELLQVIITLFEEQIQRHREIAELKDTAENANNAKSEFVSVLSHELKSPITTLKGYTSLLQTGVPGPLNETQSQFLARVAESISQMESLVSELSDISQIESGHLKLSKEALSLEKIIKSVAGTFEVHIKEKSQTLELDLDDGLSQVYGDYGRLKQVFTNLISNAHKYTPEGGTISVLAQEPSNVDGRFLHISISDDGLGIHLEEQELIFAKFYRSEDGDAREKPGTGLGLSITKELVELHGGRIWLESQFRQGTTFHVLLPAME
jgi:signal transduction histidine kinase